MRTALKISHTLRSWSVELGIDPATIKRKLTQQEIEIEIGKPIKGRDIFKALTAESDKELAQTRKANAEAAKVERINKIESGQLHCKSEIEKGIWQELLQPLRTEMQQMPKAICARCVSPEDAQEALQNWVDETFNKLNK
jgi:hypothetical protein